MKLAVLPAYNEGTALGSVILKARRHVDRVVVVDDGSSDDTAEVARLAGASVHSHDRNRGYGAAIQSCFAVAKAEKADAMVIIDADHLCMSMRGTRKSGSRTVTSAVRGIFRTKQSTREEMLELIRE